MSTQIGPTLALRFGGMVASSRLCVRPVLAGLLFLFASLVRAQDTQFLFDPNGNLVSRAAASTALPLIIGQPQNRIVAPGEAATFTVVSADTRLLTYQWQFNGTNITGATNDAVLLQKVGTDGEGEYRVVLTNPSGSVTSAPAMLWFDGDADGMADSFELAHFGDLNQLPNGDFDGDGASNVQEFIDSTNPSDANSVRFHLTVVRDGGSVVVSPELPSYTNGQSVTLTAVALPGGEPFHAWLGDVALRDNPLTLEITNNRSLFARFTPVLFTWTNVFSGDWNVAANWTPNLAPGSNDNVVISLATGPAVTLNTSADCNDFTLGADIVPMTSAGIGTLTGTGTLTVRGNAAWHQGTMSGSGRTVIEAGGSLTIANASSALTILSSRTVENGGTVRWSGAVGFTLNSSAVLTNRPGALLDIQNAAVFSANAGISRIDNEGTFRKSLNTGTATIGSGINFNNSGAVEVEAGTLLFSGGFNNNGAVNVSSGATNRLASGGASGGTFTALANAAVEYTGGTFTLNPGAQLDGAGLYRINNGTVTANTDLAIEKLAFLAGTLSGSNLVTVLESMTWTGGTMSGGGRTVIAPGATLNAAIPSVAILSGRVLENGGTIFFTGIGNLGVTGNAVITNRQGGLFNFENESTFGLGGSANGRFDNAGTFRKSTGIGTSTIVSGLSFNNSGTVDIRSGILAANGGYSSATNALLNCALGGTTAGTGYGQLKVAGTVTLNGALSVELINGFVPAINDTFAVLTASTRNGSFPSFSYPSNVVTLQLSNSPTSVIVRVSDVLTNIPPPLLLMPEIVGSSLSLTWTAASNVTYRLEFSPDLANPTIWNTVPGDITATSDRASKLEPLTSSNRFYRLRVLP